MKVETNIRAGNALQDAASQASAMASQVSAIAGQATDYVSQANRQASDFTNAVVNKSTALWNCLSSSL